MLIGRFVDEVGRVGVAIFRVVDGKLFVVEVSSEGVDDGWRFGSFLSVENDILPSAT